MLVNTKSKGDKTPVEHSLLSPDTELEVTTVRLSWIPGGKFQSFPELLQNSVSPPFSKQNFLRASRKLDEPKLG